MKETNNQQKMDDYTYAYQLSCCGADQSIGRFFMNCIVCFSFSPLAFLSDVKSRYLVERNSAEWSSFFTSVTLNFS